ncbi:MAG TPA: hypothetical protein VGG99_10865 [Acetobacteraceae bacterium]
MPEEQTAWRRANGRDQFRVAALEQPDRRIDLGERLPDRGKPLFRRRDLARLRRRPTMRKVSRCGIDIWHAIVGAAARILRWSMLHNTAAVRPARAPRGPAASDPPRQGAHTEAEPGRFLQPRVGLRHLADFAGQADLAQTPYRQGWERDYSRFARPLRQSQQPNRIAVNIAR